MAIPSRTKRLCLVLLSERHIEVGAFTLGVTCVGFAACRQNGIGVGCLMFHVTHPPQLVNWYRHSGLGLAEDRIGDYAMPTATSGYHGVDADRPADHGMPITWTAPYPRAGAARSARSSSELAEHASHTQEL